MTETAKERIYREAFEEIKRVCDTQNHVDNYLLRFFITKKMMEIEKLPVTTDKLSVEKLIEKEIEDYEESYKISGRRSENYIAGILEGLKIARAHVIDSLSTDEKTVEKLQEQLNTAKKALTEICEFDCSDDCYFTARDALAAIGNEGSGDE